MGRRTSGGVEDGIRIEPSNLGVPEIVIYLEDPDLNTPETSGGAESVAIECMDRGGAVVFRGRENWPFSDTDGGIFDPHVHVRVDQAILGLIDRCRLKGTDPRSRAAVLNGADRRRDLRVGHRRIA